MDADCPLFDPACRQAVLDQLTVISGIFWSLGAILLQWHLYTSETPADHNFDEDWP